MSTIIERNEIIRNFSRGVNCSQLVVLQWAEELGLDEEMALCLALPFGGGCMSGNICGCVSGALMMIGLEYGNCDIADSDTQVLIKTEEFRKKFIEKYGFLNCRDLIGYDYSNEEERSKALESGVIFEKCPDYVNAALEILDEMID